MKNRIKAVMFVLLISIMVAGNLFAPRYQSTTSKIEKNSQLLSKGNVKPVVTDIQANTNTTNDQYNPSVSRLTDTTFVVVWNSYWQDGLNDGYNILASVFNAATGANLTAEFRVNNCTLLNQIYPSVSTLTDDMFVVTWQSYFQDGDNWGIFASVFDAATGENLTKEFQVNTNTTNAQMDPSVSALTEDTFVVAWHSYGQDGDGRGVYASVFNATTGENLTKEFQVNTYTASDQRGPSVSALTDDTFVVAWHSDGQDGDLTGVFASVFNATTGENLTAEFQVNTYTASDQRGPSVSALTDDTFVVTWHSWGQDGSLNGVFASVFNATTGKNLTKEFQVNTYTTNSQMNPSVSALTDDTFVVTWHSYLQDGNLTGVYASVFNAITGKNLTAEFQVNIYTASDQRYPSVSALTKDTFVVAWESDGQDGDAYGIFFSVFSCGKSEGGIPGFELFYMLWGLVLITTFYLIYARRRTDPTIASQK